MICRIFADKVFDLMKWEREYRYKILAKPASCDGEFNLLFKLTDFEVFMITGTNKNRGYLQNDWRDFFGVPVEKHEESYKVNIAEGYLTTDKA